MAVLPFVCAAGIIFLFFLQRMRQIIRMLLIVLTGIVLYNEKNEKINDCLERQEEA